MTLIQGMFLASACAGRCGTTVYTVPRYLGAGRCIDCGRAHHGAAVPVRPVPGRNNHLRMGQSGEAWPGVLVDDRERVMEAARVAGLARLPRPVGQARAPAEGDGLPRTFGALVGQGGALARVRCFEVWRIASEKDGRAAGWSPQWRAGVAVPEGSGRWRVASWWRWSDVARWTPAGSRAQIEQKGCSVTGGDRG